jgi:hypothetical protein
MAQEEADKSPATEIKLAHLVNCFQPRPGSEFSFVQSITLESMLRAKAKAPCQVQLLSAHFEEDQAVVPEGFISTPFLQRSVRDVWMDDQLPPLPLIADLLQNLYEASDADYLIYTNIDIALQPHFYAAVLSFIQQGHDAFIINRRRIPATYNSIDQLPQMYAEGGKPHPGFDCFVFKRELFPKFVLGEVCIGIPFIEILFGQNLFCFAQKFKLFEEEHLTFHIGEDIFKPRNPRLLTHNRAEFWAAVKSLWPHLNSRKFPYGEKPLPIRLWKWGLHPCIPIRLCLMLEWRQLLGK